MGTRFVFRCVNFVLVVLLCWLPLYLHFWSYKAEDFEHLHQSGEFGTEGNVGRLIHTQGRTENTSLLSGDLHGKQLGENLIVRGRKAKAVRLTVRRQPRKFSTADVGFKDSKGIPRSFGRIGTFADKDYGGVKLASFQHVPLIKWRKDGPGENGEPVHLSPVEQQRAEATFDLNHFNLVVSEKIALNRSLPNVRPHRCRTLRYSESLPDTSVIIVFHNEAWSTLLRTVTSVITRSPRNLLREIILVDDASDSKCAWLQRPLEDYVAGLLVLVRVERLTRRQGIVAARHLGVAVSTGQVLTFLDSHCEVTTGWLEPLLERISQDRTRVPSPVIDAISDHTFEYSADPRGWPLLGGFSWLPEFVWTEVPIREQRRVGYQKHLPLRTPTIAGGLFSIHREFFHRLGGYDSGLRVWGGENLELSFKVWQCGGSLEIVPCSHVGHIFRSAPPYGFPDGAEATVLRNNRRVLEVWADRYTRELMYAIAPAYRSVAYGDLTGQMERRDQLQCKDFRWYLKTVYPDNNLPFEFRTLGAIKNLGINVCLDDTASRKDGKRDEDTDAVLDLCHGTGPGQVFAYTMLEQLQHDRHCLTATEGSQVPLSFCMGDKKPNSNQRWTYNTMDKTIVSAENGRCLDVKPSENVDGFFVAATDECNSALSQQWTMHNITIRGFS